MMTKQGGWFLYLLLPAVVAVVAGFALASGGLPRHDFTESTSTGSQTEYVTVVFKDPPAASYEGGIQGLAATKPARGEKLDPNDPDVQAYVDYLAEIHQNYRDYLASHAPKAEIVREYFLVANAFAVKLNGESRQTLAQGPGVGVARFSTLHLPTMNVSVGLIRAADLWGKILGGRSNAGAGIKVGVIDSGIDDTHRFFACKDEIRHRVYASGVAFDPDNVLVSDHGTHVSGTAAGCVIDLEDGPVTGTISGVAPAAELSDYNVFPGFGAGFVAFGGAALSHDIIAALEDTVKDGMDVVNMSLGGGVEGPRDILAEAVNSTVDAGIVVAVAAGNSGPGDSTINSPGSAAKALTAGASTNPHFIGILVTVSDSDLGTIGAAVGDFLNFDPPLVDTVYTTTTPANGCETIQEDLTGTIALIDRGECFFTTKIQNAEDAGAVGVLIVNNVAGDPVAMGHAGGDLPGIPAAMVSKNDGNAMKPSGVASVDGTQLSEFVTENADIIAGFSSRGPTPFTFLIKPDGTAPGVNVYSSVFNDQFALFQGTSMATPHFTGSAALLLQLHSDWSPADVKSALANAAERVVTDHVTGTVDPGVLARGGGRINLVRAEGTPLTIDPASASFGRFVGNVDVTGTVDLLIRNVSGKQQICSVEVTGPDIVTASASSILLRAGETTTLKLDLNGGRSDQTPSGDYDGDVVIDCGKTAVTLRVPWWLRVDRGASSP